MRTYTDICSTFAKMIEYGICPQCLIRKMTNRHKCIRQKVNKGNFIMEGITEHGMITWHKLSGTHKSSIIYSHEYHSHFIDVTGESFTIESSILSWIFQGRGDD